MVFIIFSETFFKKLGKFQDKIKNPLIIGGGRITHYLVNIIDKFQVYEHMLNRIQYQFEDIEEVDVDLLIQEMFTYIFADKDNVIINDKIRSLMYELPFSSS